MRHIAGLGNPGRKYSGTRHNLGFEAVDLLAKRHGIEFKEIHECLTGSGSVKGAASLLIKPLTYMNLSGEAVRRVIKYPDNEAGNLIVIHDDLDIEPGKIKIRPGGSSGGHNGIESIIERLGTRDFIRVRIGIGRAPGEDSAEYVLSKPSKSERVLLDEAVILAVEAVETIVSEGLQTAMNRFNQKAKDSQ